MPYEMGLQVSHRLYTEVPAKSVVW